MRVFATGPRIARPVRLNFQGDWGQANFHIVCSWLSQELVDRCGVGSKVAIWTGVGGADAARAVADRSVDLAISTPAAMARNAMEGRGMHRGKPIPELRAIGVLPQDDRLILGIRRELGIRSFAELRERKPALRVAISVDDGCNHIGYVSHRLLEAAGVGRTVIESWGGAFYEAERPDTCLHLLHTGEVDAVVQEAVMARWWHEDRSAALNFLPVEDSVLEQLQAQTGLVRNTLPRGYFWDLEQTLVSVDFSDFVVLVHAELPDDLAYMITWCFTETRRHLEQRYHHMPQHRATIGYPLVPRNMAITPVPLHPAAEQVYRELGYLDGARKLSHS